MRYDAPSQKAFWLQHTEDGVLTIVTFERIYDHLGAHDRGSNPNRSGCPSEKAAGNPKIAGRALRAAVWGEGTQHANWSAQGPVVLGK